MFDRGAGRTVSLTREELYEQVWSTPMQRLADRYGISDVALAKTCRKHIIPVPTRGYWRRKETGRAPERPPLPRPRPGAPDTVTLTSQRGPAPPPNPTDISTREAYESLPENRVYVAERLANPHPLVRDSTTILNARRSGSEIVCPRPADRCLDVRVAPTCLGRAFRILDALIKALEARAIPVRIGADPKHRMQITLFGENVGFWIEERTEARPHAPDKREIRHGYSYQKWDRVPTGELRLRIGDYYLDHSRKTWSDGHRGRLEDRLNDFIVGLAIAADGLRARTLHWKRMREEEEERQRQRELAEQRRREEAQRVQVLNDQVDGWLRAKEVRAFAQEVERRAGLGGALTDTQLDQWLIWARRYADQMDPFTRHLMSPAPSVTSAMIPRSIRTER